MRIGIQQSGLWAKDVHYCGSDEYRCIYKFESSNRFTVHIEVEGTNKKYSMDTTYYQTHPKKRLAITEPRLRLDRI